MSAGVGMGCMCVGDALYRRQKPLKWKFPIFRFSFSFHEMFIAL